ncbi:hypothetical protein KTS45_15220 [Halomicroarcula limicola]|uniref:Uncharacterized protein n=1 Tax=Haloarcula limicola TaxID=1429915 RepID=A0A8J8C4G9_9EURY|nr:hypothetical protein [Halomicroarcula limicola]MBV0925556.1 hypothetical protein [Halomicroarcula limicola]
MFTERSLSGEPAAVRSAYAPDALVLNCERDFETLDSAVAEQLLLVTDSVDPLAYDPSWVPDDAPEELHRFAGSDLTVGMPGDGGVAWTHQTEPPCVFVKPRLETSPTPFVEFLIAEALVEVSLDEPEHFLGFFGERYPEFARVVGDRLGPVDTYQLAAALYDAYLGLQTRAAFETWGEDYPDLYDAWADAGERLEPRLSDLAGEVARGQTEFAAAAELACSGVKHGLSLPAPFAALDTDAYREHGADYAVQWAETTFEKMG